ncbi:thiopurine S-methyltransferase [Microbulbifer taiwanensis]|uniref:Thiopurine S-methyltransferase n=1 Tax=Microbulbifer taiwanensis TaxID=986746 RepID=A0ABW1YPZ2_9GAMM|nr:thiopurine S-methyltransferase [Microbulbifer taiwanensis]
MDASFWHQKWQNNEIAFHEGRANTHLVNCFADLSLPKGGRVFVPLCGKTLDIAWLLSGGYRVAGAELSEVAVRQLFTDLGVTPEISAAGDLTLFSAEAIDIFVGDIFDLSGELLGPVDAIYDRAALVALPTEMRSRYTKHLMEITAGAPQLLITFEYDQTQMDGPPFSIGNDEVNRHYSGNYDLALAGSSDVPGGLKGKCAATEKVWLLRKD